MSGKALAGAVCLCLVLATCWPAEAAQGQRNTPKLRGGSNAAQRTAQALARHRRRRKLQYDLQQPHVHQLLLLPAPHNMSMHTTKRMRTRVCLWKHCSSRGSPPVACQAAQEGARALADPASPSSQKSPTPRTLATLAGTHQVACPVSLPTSPQVAAAPGGPLVAVAVVTTPLTSHPAAANHLTTHQAGVTPTTLHHVAATTSRPANLLAGATTSRPANLLAAVTTSRPAAAATTSHLAIRTSLLGSILRTTHTIPVHVWATSASNPASSLTAAASLAVRAATWVLARPWAAQPALTHSLSC
ncbi:hypothetical protein COO60DRAFT_1127337 [Scenedesmus sp. NREL 46B-D3]|nr:hypothetical protein COO60DRAFT_1127337 [Scenedesmus sp. NREL 46B-D3]